MTTALPIAKAFRQHDHYRKGTYRLLPIRFLQLDDARYIVTNMIGDYLLMGRPDVEVLVRGQLEPDSRLYSDLKGRQFITDGTSDVALDLLAVRYRTARAAARHFTGLHLFVTTLRCDHSCPYCQVSRVSEDRSKYDMTEETAERAIALMFRSPSRTLKVEFQGGESLLNFPLVRYVVERVKEKNDGRNIQFVIATNLSPLTDEILDYCRLHGILISTSLDGPEALHNKNRPRPERDSHQRAVRGIQRVRSALGPDAIGALMTTTAESLFMPEAIIDEYLKQGFNSIFLRSISPFGFAVKSKAKTGYETERFLEFYRRGLAYVLDLNRNGVPFREDFASIILTKVFAPTGTAYVDLQSPAGAGTMAIVYNYDGGVYASDEARMLAEMGDDSFRLGDVYTSSYEDLFVASGLIETLHGTMAEGTPMCEECAFQTWCGTDPVLHQATQGDPIGHRPTSAFCTKHMGIFKHLVTLMEDDPYAAKVLRSWVRG